MWEVEFISTETIKPSSPTPHHLRTYKLSMIDQLSPRIYVRLLLFYGSSSSNSSSASSTSTIGNIEIFQKLKTSISETLTFFYPLAGRIIQGEEEEDTVDCNDQGVDFLVAKVNGQLHHFLDDPDPQVANKFLPCDILCARSGREVLLAVQANAFDCGGTAVGIGISHKLADGRSLASFVNKWASMAREEGDVVGPSFDGPAVFPPIKVPESVQRDTFLAIEKKLTTKRFVFDPCNIARLRSALVDDGLIGTRPTRVEVVSALILRCMTAARRGGSTRALAVMHAVCMRKRMVPPLPESSFGNLCYSGITSWPPEGDQEEEECHEKDYMQRCMVRQLRDAIKFIGEDYIREMQGPHGLIKVFRPLNELMEKYSQCGLDLCVISSWCRFPIYEVDFGWGRPIWACVGTLSGKDCIILMDSNRSSDGIEAWICLEEELMAKFERDRELLSYVSLPKC